MIRQGRPLWPGADSDAPMNIVGDGFRGNPHTLTGNTNSTSFVSEPKVILNTNPHVSSQAGLKCKLVIGPPVEKFMEGIEHFGRQARIVGSCIGYRPLKTVGMVQCTVARHSG